MNVALSYLDQAWMDKAANIERCRRIARAASGHGADLVVFPEMTLTGFVVDTPSVVEARESSRSIDALSVIARDERIAVIAGAALASGATCNNVALAWDKQGVLLDSYEKIHPFTFSGESQHIAGGERLGVVTVEGVRLGLTICYDLRFPALYAALADKCECIINIANWPASRIDHWQTLLRSRAIENQLYVIGVNRVGSDGAGLSYEPSSVAFGPDGGQLAPSTANPDFDIVDIDPSRVETYRRAFPVRADRRADLYSALSRG
jgi:predicted amidohydrolase